MKNEVFFIFASEVQPNLSTISANRGKHKMKNEVFFIFASEVQPNLSTISANRGKHKMKSEFFSFLLTLGHEGICCSSCF